RLDEALDHFEQERRLSPDDPLVNARLGMALVEARREREALPHLELAGRWDGASADTFYYLGRCLVALDRPADAAVALRRALTVSKADDQDAKRAANLHYQLAVALRAAGRADEAAAEFTEAQRLSVARADSERERLTRYLTPGDPQRTSARGIAIELPQAAALAALGAAERRDVRQRVTTALERSYLNIGI